jgi:hypothetical protein
MVEGVCELTLKFYTMPRIDYGGGLPVGAFGVEHLWTTKWKACGINPDTERDQLTFISADPAETFSGAQTIDQYSPCPDGYEPSINWSSLTLEVGCGGYPGSCCYWNGCGDSMSELECENIDGVYRTGVKCIDEECNPFP